MQHFIDEATYPDIWDGRKAYAIRVLISLKEDYLKNHLDRKCPYDFDDSHVEYEKENPYPVKPKRIWVSVLNGHATKKGEKYIKGCSKWELGFVKWFKERLDRWQSSIDEIVKYTNREIKSLRKLLRKLDPLEK